ncbi:MAG: hypothetical protein IIZ48_02475 [Erysipelotrichales bacterium]|nr:hypothetical protein [Erysipelotrichales bacterium]
MKKYLWIVLMTAALLAGCAHSSSDTETYSCLSSKEPAGKTRTVTFLSDGANVTELSQTIIFDTSSDPEYTVDSYIEEIIRTAPFYNEPVTGITYEMNSVGTTVTVTMRADFREAAKPVAEDLGIFDPSIIRGDDSGYVIRAEDLLNDLKKTEGMNASCELVPEG